MVPGNKFRILFYLFLLFTLITTGCSEKGMTGNPVEEEALKLSSDIDLPAEVLSAPAIVQQAYQFAAANPEVLKQIPCYCGCGAMGHTSNYACYVAGQDQDGALLFDNHALGCSICVDITQDTMRLMGDGKSVDEIRTYVDNTYAQYGPSNIP